MEAQSAHQSGVHLDRNTVEIRSAKFRKDGGIDVKWKVPFEVPGGEPSIQEVTVPNPNARHPELNEALKVLAGHFGRIIGLYGDNRDRDSEKLRNDRATSTWFEEMESRVKVNGMTFGGKEDDPCVLISGEFKEQVDEQTIGMASHYIHLASTNYKFAGGLTEVVEWIKREVMAYHFDQKYQQLQLDFNPSNTEEEIIK